VPDDVVVRCGLRDGLELDRPLLRALRRELQHAEAMAVAARTLRHRDISTKRLTERLSRAGVPAGASAGAIGTLAETGILDDTRLAASRAAALVERGWGDAAIAARLGVEGIGEADAREAIAALPPEAERAREIAGVLSDPRKAWALLARRGFDESTIEDVAGGWTREFEEG
jgi:SOS response regulatory protein OraA/RecX